LAGAFAAVLALLPIAVVRAPSRRGGPAVAMPAADPAANGAAQPER
jgi:hypothetical protein